MKRLNRILWAAFLMLALAVFFPMQASAGTDHKTPAKKGNEDPFLNGAPFTFDQVLRLVGENAIPLHRRKDAIQARGVDFALTPAEIDKLKAAGATDDVLKLIKSKAKVETAVVTPPPAPKPVPTGSLAVTCAPAECDITLNGTPLGPTKDGHIEMAHLRPGNWIVEFKKNGYIGKQTTVPVEVDKATPVAAVLDPDRATQEAFGAELFKKIVQSLGGDEGLRAQASVQAVGSAVMGAKEGHSIRWTLFMRNRPERALFQIRAGGGILNEVSFVGSEYKTSKNLKGQNALELPTEFGLIRDNQLPALLSRLSNPQFKMIATHTTPVEGEDYMLFAENTTEKIAIGVDKDLRPQRIRITTTAGVGSAVITYSDYLQKDKACYPKAMVIKAEGSDQGIDIHFDTVDFNPALKDNDYKLRGKPFANAVDN